MPPPMIRLSGTRRGFLTSAFAASRWSAVTVEPLLTPVPQEYRMRGSSSA